MLKKIFTSIMAFTLATGSLTLPETMLNSKDVNAAEEFKRNWYVCFLQM